MSINFSVMSSRIIALEFSRFLNDVTRKNFSSVSFRNSLFENFMPFLVSLSRFLHRHSDFASVQFTIWMHPETSTSFLMNSDDLRCVLFEQSTK